MSEELFYCYDNDIKEVADKLKVSTDADVGYIFITDLHNGAYLTMDEEEHLTGYQDPEYVALREKRMIKQLEAVAEIAKNNDEIEFIAVGGDIINGYETAENAREIATGQITRQLDPLKKAGKPVFVVMGNHDDGSFHRIYYPWGGKIKPEIVFSDKYWKEHFLTPYIPEDAVFDKEYEWSKYYYYDIKKNDKTTRVIVLDTFDARLPFDEEGTVTKCDKSMLFYGHSQNELKWLATQALTPDFDGDVIFISHIAMNNEINFDDNPGGEELTALLDAFQNKLIFFDEESGIEVDYTENKGKILSYSFGHMHSELVYYDEKTKIASIGTGTATTNGGGGSPGRENCPQFTILSRGWANEKEPCFDVILVSRERLLKFNVGAGFDAEIILD